MTYTTDFDDLSSTVTIGYWYDPFSRSWVIQRLDADNVQLGTALYIGSGRADAMLEVAQLSAEHNAPAVKRI